MKKMVYVIIAVMALVFLVNVSAVSNDDLLKVESDSGIVEFNPLY